MATAPQHAHSLPSVPCPEVLSLTSQEGLAEPVTIKQRPEGAHRQEKSFPGLGKSKYKGPEVGTSFVMFGYSKEASVAGAGWARHKVGRDGVREESWAGQVVKATGSHGRVLGR